MSDIRDKTDPLDWYIEVCVVCGCQLGPGVGSRTNTGRCIIESHRSKGGIIVRVVGRHPIEQDDITKRFYKNHPELVYKGPIIDSKLGN